MPLCFAPWQAVQRQWQTGIGAVSSFSARFIRVPVSNVQKTLILPAFHTITVITNNYLS
jgi:hypothetical protein